MSWFNQAPEAVQPDFGSIHPLEGMRNQLADEEGATFLVAMEAIKRFFTKYRSQLEKPPFKALQGSYRIPNPEKTSSSATLKVTVQTLPDVTAELAAQTDSAFADSSNGNPIANFPVLRDDYVPEGSLIVLTQFQRSWLECLRQNPAVVYQTAGKGHNLSQPELPVVLIQTSRPKAKTLIQQLQMAEGVQAVCFNPGNDPFSGEAFELGLVQTGDGELHLFAEYETSTGTDRRLLEGWNQWQQAASGCCAVVIASGITGSAKGKPGLKDILGVFEARYRSPQDLHLPPLMLQYAPDWDDD
ncbi:MAG: hypothetical protein HC922_08725 [Leptolyngbyaceae cyanobacterium SM2_3_12]|nr:hypothetical protein [Leptolyngbyaceae cyanobacterium SM2_3_12]